MHYALRNRPRDVGQARGRFLTERFGRELLGARAAAGLTQRNVAQLAGVSQTLVSRVERGRTDLTLAVASRLAAAVGGELGASLHAGPGVGLRDSGQLRVAEHIRSSLPAGARVRLEGPIGPRDARAADMIVQVPGEVAMIEIDRWVADFQSQYRAAQRKREALGARMGVPVRFVWVVIDTPRNRHHLAQHAGLIAGAFPVQPRRAWAALRAGTPLGADALIWFRDRARFRR